MPAKALSVLLGVELVLVAAVLAQPVPVGLEFQVNTYTTGSQIWPSVSMDASGNFVVVWTDGPIATIVKGRRFDSQATPAGSEFRINTHTLYRQTFPSVSMDAAGSFVVVWQSSNAMDNFSTGIFGRFIDTPVPAGQPEFLVSSYNSPNPRNPSVSMDALGNFVVVWQSRFQDGDGEGIFGQRFGPTGAPVGVEFQVNTHTISHQSHPDVAVDGQGGFVVVWRSESQDGDSAGIFGQRFDPTGAPDGPEFQINTYSLYDQVRPAVATNESGNFAVAWESYRQDGSLYGVFGQRFDDTGGPLGDEFQVNSFTDADQFFPSVAMDGSGRFVVMWESAEQDGSGYGIIGQSFDSSGERIGGEFQANTYTEDFQFDPSIAMNASGDFVVVWVSGGQDGSGRGIFGQRFVLLEPCEEPDPRNQGFWYRQCLGAGLIGPGRAGRGPQGNIDDFVDVIEPAVSSRLQATVSVDSACEGGMDADPQSDPCEKALKQYTALLFNLESDRLCTSCGIDLVSEGCVSPSVGELVDELAGLINSDGGESCKLAMRCAAAVNTGSAVNSR